MASSPYQEGMHHWLNDHQELRGLFKQYMALTSGSPPAYQDASTKQDIKRTVEQIRASLTRHQSAEDRTLYAEFGKVIPEQLGGNTLQSHAHMMDTIGRYQLQWLEEHADPSNDVDWRLYHETVFLLIMANEAHMKHEEEIGLPYLIKHLSPGELGRLDREYVEAKRSAPLHPRSSGVVHLCP